MAEAGIYGKAIEEFLALGEYRDSSDRVIETRYAAAAALLEEGKNYEAARSFYALEDYQDARERCFDIWEQITPQGLISAGEAFTLGLKADGTVVAAGSNYSGQCEATDWRNIQVPER